MLEQPRVLTAARAAERGVQESSAWGALAAGLAAAAVACALVAPFMARYGWDRDELYFLAATHHLALGYVDFPPATALIGWLVGRVAPHSLVALRCVSLACGAATVLLVASTARVLGGGRTAQWLAAFGWALTPYILGSGALFHPTWLDCLAWVAFLHVAVRLLVLQRRTIQRERRLWLGLGAIAGLGLEAKYTIVFLLAAFGLSLVATRERRALATAGPWMGLAVALALLAPNLAWQVAHGWPSLRFASSQNAVAAAATSRPAYIAEQVLFLGASSALAVAGVAWLWRTRRRALALVPVLVTAMLLLEQGRGYYPLPADSVAVAAGAVAFERWSRPVRLAQRVSRSRRGRAPAALGVLVAVQAAAIVFVAPIVVPLYGTRRMVQTPLVWRNGYFKDEIGWPEMTAEVQRAWGRLSPALRAHGAVLTLNYGEAGALALYGHGLGPVLSGHLSWQYWRPARLPQRYVLTVGVYPEQLTRLCRSWRAMARIDNRWHLDNEERGRLIAFCALREPLGRLWSRFIATDQL